MLYDALLVLRAGFLAGYCKVLYNYIHVYVRCMYCFYAQHIVSLYFWDPPIFSYIFFKFAL